MNDLACPICQSVFSEDSMCICLFITEPCRTCRDSRKCFYCDGKKKVEAADGKLVDCKLCKGDGKCFKCN